jgi:hypothetical protein
VIRALPSRAVSNDTGVKTFTRRVVSLALMAAVAVPATAQTNEPTRCRGSAGYTQTEIGVRTFLWRPEWLVAQRTRVRADRRLSQRWRQAANAALSRAHRSVIDKLRVPASGDRHDYYSIGPYWWPTQGAANGLPYVRRDGDVNPERSGPEFDHAALQQLSRDVRLLALAYDHLGERAYAERAAALIRMWFIDPATRMNPNFTHAQAIPGVNSGRAEGIIEAIALPDIIESIGLLERAEVLTATDQTALRRWFTELVQWMASSENGRAERRATNNHGMYYDYLFAHFALFAGLDPLVVDMANEFPALRLAPQMAADGRLPTELARTRPFHYTIFALDAAGRLAALGACVNRDLWQARTATGQSLAQGINWAGPFIVEPDSWQRADSDFAEPRRRAREIADAGQLLRSFQWAGLARAMPSPPIGEDRVGELIIPVVGQQ